MSRLAPLPSPDDWTAEEDRLGFFGPGSVTWRVHGDPAYQAMNEAQLAAVATLLTAELVA